MLYQVITRPEWDQGKIVSGWKSLAMSWEKALETAKNVWGDECVIVQALKNTPLAYFPESPELDDF